MTLARLLSILLCVNLLPLVGACGPSDDDDSALADDDDSAQTDDDDSTQADDDDAVGDCSDDSYEENDSQKYATPMNPGTYSDLWSCPGDADWYAVTVTEAGSITIGVDVSDPDLVLEVRLKDSQGDDLALGDSSSKGGSFVLTAAVEPGTHYIVCTAIQSEDNIGAGYELSF